MRPIKVEDLMEFRKKALHMPWGVGNPHLEKNSESWAPYLRFLYLFVKNYQPEAVIECGVYMATATEHMALANMNTFVVGIDWHFHSHAHKVEKRYDNISFVQGNTTNTYTRDRVRSVLGHDKVGLLFLDSTHDGDTPRREFELYSEFFDDNVLVACDDLIGPKHLEEKMQEFWKWLPGTKLEFHDLHPRLNDSYDLPGFGVSIISK